MGDARESNTDTYILSRGGLASARLTTQHYVLTERQGWMIHPQVQKSLQGKKNIKFLDLATGNGVWAINISKEYPDAEVIGLDISSKQFPPAFTLPKNVSFDIYNIFDPVPEQYRNCFDLIHIRLIVGAIYSSDKDALLSNLKSMLKPGGYLQWDEVVGDATVLTDESMHLDKSLQPVIERVDKVTGVLSATRWADELPRHLEEHGFTSVLRHKPPVRRESIPYESECMVWSMQEMIDVAKDMPKKGAKEEMAQAQHELQDDVEAGKLWTYDWLVALGQRPVEA